MKTDLSNAQVLALWLKNKYTYSRSTFIQGKVSVYFKGIGEVFSFMGHQWADDCQVLEPFAKYRNQALTNLWQQDYALESAQTYVTVDGYNFSLTDYEMSYEVRDKVISAEKAARGA